MKWMKQYIVVIHTSYEKEVRNNTNHPGNLYHQLSIFWYPKAAAVLTTIKPWNYCLTLSRRSGLQRSLKTSILRFYSSMEYECCHCSNVFAAPSADAAFPALTCSSHHNYCISSCNLPFAIIFATVRWA